MGLPPSSATRGGCLSRSPIDLGALGPPSGRDRHRPQTREEMRAAARELRDRGYSDHAIAAATSLSVEQIRRMLGEAPP